MAQPICFFAGANSGSGFQNLFSELVAPETAYDFIILKGGPGVGKSTFLRSLGQAMEAAGTAVEYDFCSGDPDSLDAVLCPELGCGAADGTSPHVLEPRYPAAVDRYLDLGQFYDVDAIKRRSSEIREYTASYRSCYEQAYRSLKAARTVEENAIAAAKESFSREKLARRFDGILRRELKKRGSGSGRVQRRFLGSLTCKGAVWKFDTVDRLCPRVYELEDHWEIGGALLSRAAEAAAGRGYDLILCPSPEEISRPEHLLIPEAGLAFVTSRPGMKYPQKPYRRIRVDALIRPENGGYLRFQRRLASSLRRDGVLLLGEAKRCHDALEACYNPHVDFDGVRALAQREAQRWSARLDAVRAKQ